MGFPGGSDGLQFRRPGFYPLGWEDPLEEGIATYSSILAWGIPWTEEPDRLQSVHGGSKSLTRLSIPLSFVPLLCYFLNFTSDRNLMMLLSFLL